MYILRLLQSLDSNFLKYLYESILKFAPFVDTNRMPTSFPHLVIINKSDSYLIGVKLAHMLNKTNECKRQNQLFIFALRVGHALTPGRLLKIGGVVITTADATS